MGGEQSNPSEPLILAPPAREIPISPARATTHSMTIASVPPTVISYSSVLPRRNRFRMWSAGAFRHHPVLSDIGFNLSQQ
jgi:hypothetical protein